MQLRVRTVFDVLPFFCDGAQILPQNAVALHFLNEPVRRMARETVYDWLPPLTSKAIVRGYVMRLAAQCPTNSST
jgi:hypothetical protein